MARQGRRGLEIGVALLMYELMTYGIQNIPRGTMGLIIFQTCVFLGFIPSMNLFTTLNNCLLPKRIIYKKELERLLMSTYMHGDDMHLYYNMMSFLVKGVQLEPVVGTCYFVYLIFTFGILINMLVTALSYGLESIIGFNELGLMNHCAVGFSGVIFALKVLCQDYDLMSRRSAFYRRHRSIFNLSCWAELVLIQLATPNASFIGHLCGILVGLLYTRGFLKMPLDTLYSVFTSFANRQPRSAPHNHHRWSYNFDRGNSNNFDRGTNAAYADMTEEEALWEAINRNQRHERGIFVALAISGPRLALAFVLVTILIVQMFTNQRAPLFDEASVFKLEIDYIRLGHCFEQSNVARNFLHPTWSIIVFRLRQDGRFGQRLLPRLGVPGAVWNCRLPLIGRRCRCVNGHDEHGLP